MTSQQQGWQQQYPADGHACAEKHRPQIPPNAAQQVLHWQLIVATGIEITVGCNGSHPPQYVACNCINGCKIKQCTDGSEQCRPSPKSLSLLLPKISHHQPTQQRQHEQHRFFAKETKRKARCQCKRGAYGPILPVPKPMPIHTGQCRRDAAHHQNVGHDFV